MIEIQEIALSKLKKSKLFKRKHTSEQLERCIHSLERYGQYTPLVVSGKEILCGNLVYDAMRKLKWKKGSIYDLGELTTEKKQEIRFLDNHTFDISKWKEEPLKDFLMSLDVGKLLDCGYNLEESERLINGLDDDIKNSPDLKDLGIEDVWYCEACGWEGNLNVKEEKK